MIYFSNPNIINQSKIWNATRPSDIELTKPASN